MRRKSVTSRLLVLTLLALMPALLVLTYNLLSARQAAYREIHNSALVTGHLASLEVRRIVSSIQSTLDVLSTVPMLRTGAGRPCSDYVRVVENKLEMLENITVFSATGDVVCTSKPATASHFTEGTYYQEALAAGNFVVGTYLVDRVTGEATLPLALPVLDQGEVRQIIVAYLDLKWLAKRVHERDYSSGGNSLTIADRNGVILAREPFPERFVGTSIPEEFRYLVQEKIPGTIELTSQDGTRRVVAYYPDQDGLYVSAGYSVEGGLQQVRQVTRFGLAVIALAIVGPFFAVWWAGHTLIRRPAHEIVRSIDAWRHGNESVRTGMKGDGAFGIIGSAVDAFMDELALRREQQLQDDRMRQILIRELDHRIKNILSMVQAVARQTFRSSDSVAEISEAFFRRLDAMAGAHQLLTKNWQSASLKATVEKAISPFEDPNLNRFHIQGADLEAPSSIALSLSMALHELSTNAAKYGALSNESGRVDIAWTCSSEPDGEFVFTWTERGGPPVAPPQREGFGTLMIARVLSQQLQAKVKLDYRPEGLSCRIEAPLASITIKPDHEPDDALPLSEKPG